MLARLIVIVILFGAGMMINAQDRIKNPTSVGPQVGYQKAADADGQMMYGAALRLKLTNSLAFEASLNYRQEEYADKRIKVETWPVLLSGLIYPAENLYGTFGVGWYNTKIDYQSDLGISDYSGSEFGWHFGAGVEIPLGESVLLTPDFKYVFLDYNFEEVPGAGEINNDYFVINVGLLFRIN
jgi:opacity protein-like surface antigen